MMKLAFLTGMVVVSLGATACVGAPEEEGTTDQAGNDQAGDENVGETSDALNKIDVVGNIPWGAQAGWTSDTWIEHSIWGVLNKDITVRSYGDFPQFTGPYTTAKYNNCKASYVETFLYKSTGSSGPWTNFQSYTTYAEPTMVWDPSIGIKITSCFAAMEEIGQCNAIHFGVSNYMRVDVLAWGGDGSLGQKSDIVQRPEINLANCF